MTQWQHERRGTTEDADDHPAAAVSRPARPAPFPALINLTVPAGNILGWSAAPGEAGGWGLTDPGDTRRLVQAASAHPRTRWCFTLLGPDGTAVAHGCARGPHPWIPPPDSGQRNRDGPDARQAAALADTAARPQRHLHPDRQGQLRPRQRRKPLHPQPQAQAPGPGPHRDLPRARLRRPRRTTATSTTPSPTPPGSPASATWPRPADATTASSKPPAGQLTQPEPGVMRWTTPSGRTYTTRPTVYEM